MKEYVLAPEAFADLFEIWSYLAFHASVEIADCVESELYDAFKPLEQSPQADTGAGISR